MAEQKAAEKAAGVSPQQEKLLLYSLGLKLLSKGLNLAPPPNPPPSPRGVPSRPESSVAAVSSSTANSAGESNERKRRHSTLTEVEKREKRRKMNRMAAQNARDRKKEYVEDLEKKLAELERMNQQLLKENDLLKKKTSTLMVEKQDLEQLLVVACSPGTDEGDSSPRCQGNGGEGGVELAGSAAPLVSRQKKQAPLSSTALGNWVLLSLMLSITYTGSRAPLPCSGLPPPSPRVDKLMTSLERQLLSTRTLTQDQLARLLRRWGGRLKTSPSSPPPPPSPPQRN